LLCCFFRKKSCVSDEKDCVLDSYATRYSLSPMLGTLCGTQVALVLRAEDSSIGPHGTAKLSCYYSSAVVTNRGWDTNDFFPCGKARATCGDSAGRQKPHTWTWFCGGSCGLQFVSRPTAYQHMESLHEQTARQCETANQRFVSKLMMANESSKLSF